MIRILIFDDSIERLESLSTLFMHYPTIECLGAFSDPLGIEEKINQFQPDVLLMDIKMPGMDGIEATLRAKVCKPDIKVIIQTVFDEDDKIFRSLKAGAQGYILKSVPIEKVIQSIEDVYHGGAVMTPSIAMKVMQFFSLEAKASKRPEDFNLSVREQEVLKLLTEGSSYKMIAARLGISYFTVNAHIKKIYEKLQINSVGEAISFALKNKIV